MQPPEMHNGHLNERQHFASQSYRKYILNVWEITFYRGRKPQPVVCWWRTELKGTLNVHTEPGDLKELINPTVYRKQCIAFGTDAHGTGCHEKEDIGLSIQTGSLNLSL